MIDAISAEGGKLVFCIVTSNTRGKYENEGTAFGASKTTIAMQLARHYNHYEPDYNGGDFTDFGERAWDKTEGWDVLFGDWTPEEPEKSTRALWYYPHQVLNSLEKAEATGQRIKAGVWDGVQFSAGAKHGTEAKLVDMVGDLTEERPSLAIMFMTAPNILSIAAPLRPLVKYELIAFERGLFEVQQVNIQKDFKNPSRDRQRLKPLQGIDREEAKELGVDIEDYRIPALPQPIQEKYDAWRKFNKGWRRRALIEGLRQRDLMLEDEEPEEPTESGSALAHARWGRR